MENEKSTPSNSEDTLKQFKEQMQKQGQTGSANINHLTGGVCPHCGYCPTCGRPYRDYNYPYYPSIQPYYHGGAIC